MTTTMSTMNAVITAPDSNAARRALATMWRETGHPQAELVETQLAWWDGVRAGRRTTREVVELNARATALIAKHGRSWAGEVANLGSAFTFHRGLVGELELTLDALVIHGARLVQQVPLQHVVIPPGASLDRWDELCAAPWLAQIVSLEVERAPMLGDAQIASLARSRHARGLRWLGLSRSGIGRDGVEAIAASPYLDRLIFVGLSQTPCDPTPRLFDDGGVTWTEPHPLGEELQAMYGMRVWLRGPGADWPDPGIWPPDRDQLAAG